MKSDPTNIVNIAYDEMKAIADKYQLEWLITITHLESNVIRSEIFSPSTEWGVALDGSKQVISVITNMTAIVNRTARLMFKTILKMDVALRLLTAVMPWEKWHEAFTEMYSWMEEELLVEDIDDLLESVKAAAFDTKAEAAEAMKTSELPEKYKAALSWPTPRTVNKLRQINNALSGKYFGS